MEETQQINVCIDEMAKLKEKMEALEKQKILNEKNEMLKKTTMEPNLKVLENWLVDYHKRVEDEKEKINKNATEKEKIYTINRIKSMISSINSERNQLNVQNKRCRTFKYQNVDYNELEKMSLSLETEPYNLLKDKIDKIHQIYENGYYIKRVTKEEIAASHIVPTYNMFNIINKRLDDIEKKLGINNKIEIV